MRVEMPPQTPSFFCLLNLGLSSQHGKNLKGRVAEISVVLKLRFPIEQKRRAHITVTYIQEHAHKVLI